MANYERHLLGETAEQLAQNAMQAKGLKLVDKNFRCKLGEIDLIFQDKNCLVFTEVRARTCSDKMDPFESIDEYKQQKIINTAEYYLLKNHRFADYLCRFDAIAVDFSKVKPKLHWIIDAFRVGE